MTPLGLAVIGCGMAAKPHAEALSALRDRVAVQGVWARDPARRAAFCAHYALPEAPSAEALAHDPRVQAVLLLTPPNARADLVALFAGAGKHVLSEKPLERDLPAARAIADTCARAGVQLGVVFQSRFRKAAEIAAQRLASGEFGPLHMVEAVIPWWRDQAYYDAPGRGTRARDGGGVLISQAIHTLDLMLSLAGPVAELRALCATTPLHRMESEDFASASLRFVNGAVGHVMATTARYPGGAEWIGLDCARASLRLQTGQLVIRWQDGRVETLGEPATSGGGADPMAFPCDWHRALIADFAEAVQQGRAPRVTGADGLRVQALISAIETASATGRATQPDPIP